MALTNAEETVYDREKLLTLILTKVVLVALDVATKFHSVDFWS